MKSRACEKASTKAQALNLTENLYYIGAFDPKLRIFDIVCSTPFGTSYNAYLVVGSEKTAVIETVKEEFQDEFFERIDSVLTPLNRGLDYIVHNHTEPDHSGSSLALLKKYPKAIVIGSENALAYLSEIWNDKRQKTKIQTLAFPRQVKQIDLGGDIILEFINAPFLHWPDSIFTFCEKLRTLFTCDFLGTHYSFNDILLSKIEQGGTDWAEYFESYEYYRKCIFSPFGKYVLKGLDIINELVSEKKIDFVCTSHGPVLDDIGVVAEKLMPVYKTNAEKEMKRFEEKIVIIYTSAYGYTTQMAKSIASGVGSKNIPVKLVDVTVINEKVDAEVLSEIQTSKGVLFGTPTILADCLPNLLRYMGYPYINPIVNSGQIAGVFGSFGWSGEGCGNLETRLDQLKLEIPLNPMKVRFKPSDLDLKACSEFGTKFARIVGGEKIPNERVKNGAKIRSQALSSAYPMDGKLRLWKCIICGELFVGKLPPKKCDACVADGDIWIAVKIVEAPVEQNFDELYGGTIVIVGGSTAGVTCAKTIRERNRKCRVVLLSEEGLPYYRPTVTKSQVNYFYDRDWYLRQNIELIDKKVTEVDYEKKEVVCDDMRIKFDKVVLCTGSRALNFFQSASNVFTIYTPQDVEDIFSFVKRLGKEKAKVCVVGAGSLGIEISELLVQRIPELVDVTMVELDKRILPRFFDEESGVIFTEAIESHDVKLLFGHQIDHFEITKEDGVELAKNVTFKGEHKEKKMPVDIIVVSIGQENCLELLKQLELEFQPDGKRVKVNDKMETSLKDVYAAGNNCQVGKFTIGNYANAIFKGEVAGLNCIGIESKFTVQFGPYNLNAFGVNASSSGKPFGLNSMRRRDRNDYLRIAFDERNRFCGSIIVGEKTSHVKLQTALQKKITFREAVKNIF